MGDERADGAALSTAAAGDASRGLAYNPALDGLRAIAVLAVMLYHGGSSWLGGGFLGVDVFFVLSGFLITTLLLQEQERTGRLDLPAFWGRRARRLLPALLLVLLAVVAYGAFLSGEAATAIRGDAVATLFYVSNWWFIAGGNSYFAQFQDPSPLTHTWRLAIEEQWYLLLPLVLVLLLPRMRSRRVLATGFAALAAVSAVEMAWLADPASDASRVYYGTDTRLQSLLVGATLAVVLTPRVLEQMRVPARWLGPLALALVIALMVVISDRTVWLYEGGFLVFALVSAALLVTVQAHPDGMVGRVLSIPPVVWVGRISYGLYLWHWPVYVVLSPDRTGLAGWGLLLLRVAVTFGAATLSYYLVEMPVRRGALNRLPRPQRIAVALGTPVAVLGLLGVTAATAQPPAQDSLEAIRDSATRSASPHASPTSGPVEDVRAVLVGDSVALSLYAAFEPDEVPGLSVLPGTEFGCGLVPFEVALNGAKLPIRDECAKWSMERAGRISASGANLGVMFVGPWEQYDRWIGGERVPYTDPRWHEATVADYEKVLGELAAATPRQALVLDTCHGAPDLDLPDAVLFQAGRYPAVVNDRARATAVNEAAREAVKRSGLDVTVIDPNPYLCPGGYQSELDGVPLHTDGVHFTEEGARLYWTWLGPRLLKAGRTEAATPSVPAG
ncbi:MAG: acyltransferase family protein [Candidatus Nanopelagicales bacterium]